MVKFIIILVLLLFSAFGSTAQKSFRIKDYMPQDVGLTWQFRNYVRDGLSPIVLKNSQIVDGKLRRDENNGDYRLQKLTEKGLEVYQLYFVGERVIDYEQTILLIPAKVKVGEIYKSESRYTTRVKGQITERGKQTYEVKLEKTEDAETPFRRFKNCLVFRTIALRIDESGTQKGYEIEEWYAKGFGTVKVIGTLFWKNAKGETTRTFQINAELENFSR